MGACVQHHPVGASALSRVITVTPGVNFMSWRRSRHWARAGGAGLPGGQRNTRGYDRITVGLAFIERVSVRNRQTVRTVEDVYHDVSPLGDQGPSILVIQQDVG